MTRLWVFFVFIWIDSNLIHLYIDVYIFSSRFFSDIGCYRVFNKILVYTVVSGRYF